MNSIINQSNEVVSLQVAKLGNIPAGNFAPGHSFLIKNITDDAITVYIKPSHQDAIIETVIYPGWNPEIVSEVLGAPANTLQFGY